jgi:hypothetical protein
MTNSEDHEAAEYELVMPFVACASQGGPHEDQAFVAGYRLGQLDRDLEVAALIGAPSLAIAVPPVDLPQVDLIAMRHGWTVEAVPWVDAPDDWASVTFTRDEGGR